MRERKARRVGLATGMAVVAGSCLLVELVLIGLAGDSATAIASIRLGESLALVIPWLAFSIVGAIIVSHQPDNTIGWLCSVTGLQVSVVALFVGLATYCLAASPPVPVGITLAWVAHAGSITIVVAPLLILFRFPTGRSLGPWWRRAETATVVIIGTMVVGAAVDPMPLLGFPTTPNPMAIGEASRVSAISLAPAVACAGLAIAAIIVRFTRGSVVERRQIRLLAVASVLVGLAMATMSMTSPELLSGGRLMTVTAMINAIAFASIPIAIGVAIVRDGLYDIDRIVNRTLVYAIVSAVLAGVYVAVVIGITQVLTLLAPGAGGTIATAGATLVVATLFRPVRARAQAAVNRRFDRERYEAARSIDSFAGQIRAEVELDAIVGDLRLAAGRTVRPSTLGCWIRAKAAR